MRFYYFKTIKGYFDYIYLLYFNHYLLIFLSIYNVMKEICRMKASQFPAFERILNK